MTTAQVGDNVRVALSAGVFLRGVIEKETADTVTVRGRIFPRKAVETLDEIDNKISANLADFRQSLSCSAHKLEQSAPEKAKRRAARIFAHAWDEAHEEKWARENPSAAMHKKEAKRKFVMWLTADNSESRGKLFCHIRSFGALTVECTDYGYEAFEEYYFLMTGESLPEESSSVRILTELKHQRGPEYRVTFPIPDFPLPAFSDYQTMFAGGAGWLTLNSKELFEMFLQDGMRL